MPSSRSRVVRGAPLCAPLLALATACSGGGEPALSPLAREGRSVYLNVCIACHNGDPNEDGALGPAIAGSSEELLRARVVRGEYPPGYEPKRPGAVMPAFPYLEEDIPALVAYLDEVAEVSEPAAE